MAVACSLALACSSGNADDGDEPGPGVLFGDGVGAEFGAGTGSGGLAGSQVCAGETAGAESVPAVLQLVVDTSGSMDQNAPGRRGSKWTVTRQALLDAIGEMPANTSVGVVFYPDLPIQAAPRCFDEQADVDIAELGAPGSAQRRTIERELRAQDPEGGTPSHDAYRFAFEQLGQSAAVGRRFLVVITDGTPTFSLGCVGTGLISDPVDSGPLVVEAARASADGISTFVIGSPGSEGARASLSRMAEAGGTAEAGCSLDGPSYCHFDMTQARDFGAALAQALGTIAGLALSCDYDIPEPPAGQTLDPALVNVLFTPAGGARELVEKSPSGPCSEGWQYSDSGRRISLCERTCERVRASQGSLELQFGCATVVR